MSFLFCFCFYFFSWYSNRTSFAIGLKTCVITAGIKKFKSIKKKKKKKNRKKHDKIELLAKSILYSIEVLISKALIDSNISHDEFLLIKIIY